MIQFLNSYFVLKDLAFVHGICWSVGDGDSIMGGLIILC
jgi:hypothetical protein